MIRVSHRSGSSWRSGVLQRCRCAGRMRLQVPSGFWCCRCPRAECPYRCYLRWSVLVRRLVRFRVHGDWRPCLDCTRSLSLVSGDRPTKSEFPSNVASSACNVRVNDVPFLPDPVPMMRSDWEAFSHSAINLRSNTVAAVADGDGAGRDLRLRVDHPPPHSDRRCGGRCSHWPCESWHVLCLRVLGASPRTRLPRALLSVPVLSVAQPGSRCQPAPSASGAMISRRAALHCRRPRASRSSGNVSSRSCR